MQRILGLVYPITIPDNQFSVTGSSDATKLLVFQVDTQATASTLTIDVGAQAASRTLLVPVLAGTDTIATLGVANIFTVSNNAFNGVNTSFGDGTNAPNLNIRRGTGMQGGVSFQTGGSSRFIVAVNSTAEGGANAGSDFIISRYADAGTFIDNPVTITRSTGVITLSAPLPSTSGGTGVNNAGTLTNATNTTVTGGGTLALAGFTLTVPATGTAALLGTSNIFTATANRITIGSVAAVGTALGITKTQTATSGQDLGLSVVLTLANLSSKSSQNTGITGNITIDATASSTTGACVGLLGSVDVNSTTNTHVQATGVQCVVRKGGANAITTAICLDTSFSTSAAGTVGSVRGLYQSLTNSGGATITTAYGVYLEAITLGATNYAFFSAGAGLVSIGDTTDASAIGTAAVVGSGGATFAKNLLAGKAICAGITSTATAAGTTTLTSASAKTQIFTGATTQTIQFPAANLYGAGIAVEYIVINRSTGTVTPTRAGADTFVGGGTTDPITTLNQVYYVSDGVSVWYKLAV